MINADEMRGVCNMHYGDAKCLRNLSEKSEKIPLGDLSIDGRMM
jgi:hypothetical protein